MTLAKITKPELVLQYNVGDLTNEQRIDHCYREMIAAADVPTQKYWFARMAYYVERRTPGQVMRMEEGRGL